MPSFFEQVHLLAQYIEFQRLLSTEPFEMRDLLLGIVWSLDLWWGSSCSVGNKSSFSSL